jgi:hypothetical protein
VCQNSLLQELLSHDVWKGAARSNQKALQEQMLLETLLVQIGCVWLEKETIQERELLTWSDQGKVTRMLSENVR